jgi:hypothetical protein
MGKMQRETGISFSLRKLACGAMNASCLKQKAKNMDLVIAPYSFLSYLHKQHPQHAPVDEQGAISSLKLRGQA